MCKRTKSDWNKAGFEYEIDQVLYLHNTWIKCKTYKQESTGIPDTDNVIIYLFGMPHSNFGKAPPRKMPAKIARHTPEYNWGVIGLPRPEFKA